MTLYKCLNCFLGYIDARSVKVHTADGPACPECGNVLEKHCENDKPCHCAKQIHETIAYCDTCGEPVCPGCGCHDVEAVTRITGYLNALSGFNRGKAQEVKDRVRYNALTGEVVR